MVFSFVGKYIPETVIKVLDPNKPVPETSNFRLIIFTEIIVVIVNWGFQIACLYYLSTKKYLKKGSFYVLQFVLSLSIFIRITLYIFSSIYYFTIKGASDNFGGKTLVVQLSYYVDYFSDFFSLTLIFCMSLNRCLCFVAPSWDTMIFEGIRIAAPIIMSAILSLIGSVASIITSNGVRYYALRKGFVDVGEDGGFQKIANQLISMFPILSIICYAILFAHIKKRGNAGARTFHQVLGERKIFLQLLVTTILYTILLVIYQVSSSLKDVTGNQGLFSHLVISLRIANNLPEIWLPLSLIFRNFLDGKLALPRTQGIPLQVVASSESTTATRT